MISSPVGNRAPSDSFFWLEFRPDFQFQPGGWSAEDKAVTLLSPSCLSCSWQLWYVYNQHHTPRGRQAASPPPLVQRTESANRGSARTGNWKVSGWPPPLRHFLPCSREESQGMAPASLWTCGQGHQKAGESPGWLFWDLIGGLSLKTVPHQAAVCSRWVISFLWT